MTPELEFLLKNIHEDVRGIDARTRSIELKLADKTGGERVRRGFLESVKWGLMLAAAAFSGHVAGHH